MDERIDISSVIVERMHAITLCVTCDPSDDREELLQRFKPEGKEWKIDRPMEDGGDHLYLYYYKIEHPAAR